MQPKITMQIDPSELYDETDLFMALRAIDVSLYGISNGLDQCVVRDEKGDSTSEIQDFLTDLAGKLDVIGRRVLMGNLTVMRK